MKINLTILAFIALIGFTTCAHRKNAKKTAQASYPSGILVEDFSSYQNSATTNIISATVEGNLLKLNVSYSGGCEKHNFELIGSKMIQKSLPPKRGIILFHNNNNDSCRELVEEVLTFDITDFSYEKSEIILILEGYATPIPYTFAE